MVKKKERTPEEIDFLVKCFNEDYDTQLGEHFINFYIKGEKFDFNAFRSKEEWDKYNEEVEFFMKKDKERREKNK